MPCIASTKKSIANFAADISWHFDVGLSDGSRERFTATIDAFQHARDALLDLLNHEVHRRHPGSDATVVTFDFIPA